MKYEAKYTLGIAATFALGLGGLSTTVYGQQDFEENANLDEMLDEVIVTAQRRAENVQDVPISMTVLSEEQISNNNMTNSADLATYTPSLTVDTRFGFENTSFAIRGFTQSLRTAASVATYFADVVAPRGQTAQTSGDGAGPGYLFDLQNVQVLKGPQGTLFGRNTTGGAILLTPQEPTDVFEGYVEGTAANFDTKRIQAVLNIPVSDTFKVRLGVDSNEREGHLKNITGVGADRLGNSDYTATRLSFLWNISDELENYTIFQYVDSESNGYVQRLVACNPATSILDNPFYNAASVPCMRQLENEARTGQDDITDVSSEVDTPVSVIEEKRVINTTTYDISDDFTIKNIFGYAHLKTDNGSSIFGINFPEADAPNRQFTFGISAINPDFPTTMQETYVEEVQLQGSGLDENLTWQAGLYYENSRPDGFSGNTTAAFLYCDMASIEGDPSQYDCNDDGSAFGLGSVLITKFKTEFLNKAAYSQVTYDFSSELSVTAGLRYTKDEAEGHGIKEQYRYTGTTQRAMPLVVARPKVTSEKPTGMLELSYHPTENTMTFVKYTRGYRQGSVNNSADVGLDTHEPETIDTYEIGAKTSFSGPIPGQFNIAIFDNELTDMQLQNGYISPASGATTSITNAGKAVVRGVEVDAMFELVDDLTLNVAYSHLDTELKEIGNVNEEQVYNSVYNATSGTEAERLAAAQTAVLSFEPIADVGDELPFAPLNTWIASLNYLLPVSAEVGVVSLGATYVYVGQQRAASSSSTPYDVLPSYELLNLNANWLGIYNSNFDASLFVTNALDKEYAVYTAGSYSTLGFEVQQSGMPRMYGLRVRYNFGG